MIDFLPYNCDETRAIRGIDRWIRYSTTSMNAHTINSPVCNLQMNYKLKITVKLELELKFKFKLKLKLKLTDLSGRLSKLIMKAGVHLAIELTHMLRSRGMDSVVL